MDSTESETELRRSRRRLANVVKESLRDLRNQLSVLNHHVSAQVELKDVDLDCLELVSRHGPLSPSELARRTGLHPATMTGVLDRLERGGWVVRERLPSDRRAVSIRALPDRAAEIVHRYAGMSSALDRICAGYSEAELALLADFLRRCTAAGQTAAADLAAAPRT
jgi:DNA-binding MarR family transcriptional regulator